MNKKFTDEEIVKAVEHCNHTTFCEGCPLCDKPQKCGVYLTEYIKNEPAPAATGTSSEVSVKEDTDNIHLDNSALLDICQVALANISEGCGDNYSSGYAQATLDALKQLKDEQSD